MAPNFGNSHVAPANPTSGQTAVTRAAASEGEAAQTDEAHGLLIMR